MDDATGSRTDAREGRLNSSVFEVPVIPNGLRPEGSRGGDTRGSVPRSLGAELYRDDGLCALPRPVRKAARPVGAPSPLPTADCRLRPLLRLQIHRHLDRPPVAEDL